MAKWIKTSANRIPSGTMRGGYETDGKSLFVARALMQDGYVSAGKFGHHLEGAHIPYDGKELSIHEYEVLVFSTEEEGFYDWQSATLDNIPANTVPSDVNASDPKVFVGRFMHENSLVPGKVFIPHKVCYVSYAGREYAKDTYEVLFK